MSKISEGYVKRLGEKYNFKTKIISNCICIQSLTDEWYIEFGDRFLTLFHKNKRGNTNWYHPQRKYDLDINIAVIFSFIKKHDKKIKL